MILQTTQEGENAPVFVTEIESIPPGQGRCFTVGGKAIALFRLRDGRIFALDNSCPHRGGPLGAGLVGIDFNTGREAVVCPLHAFKFSLRDGAGISNELRVRHHRVELRGAAIHVAVSGGE